MASIGESVNDPGTLSALGEVAEQYEDARGMLHMGTRPPLMRWPRRPARRPRPFAGYSGKAGALAVPARI